LRFASGESTIWVMARGSALLVLGAAALVGASGCVVQREDPGPGYVTAAPVYARCSTTPDCESSYDCFNVMWERGTGGVCSADCVNHSDCPGGDAASSCYALAGDTTGLSICYQRCTFDRDCASGLVCEPVIGGRAEDSICMPI